MFMVRVLKWQEVSKIVLCLRIQITSKEATKVVTHWLAKDMYGAARAVKNISDVAQNSFEWPLLFEFMKSKIYEASKLFPVTS